jgi:hypothetical protein
VRLSQKLGIAFLVYKRKKYENLNAIILFLLMLQTEQNFMNITDHFSLAQFEALKEKMLKNGDRKTYRNYDNQNPHYILNDVDLYLNAEIGQKNINNDPKMSDFNEITVNDSINYVTFTIRIVREKDFENKQIYIHEGMEKNRIYLMNDYQNINEALKKEICEKYLNVF